MTLINSFPCNRQKQPSTIKQKLLCLFIYQNHRISFQQKRPAMSAIEYFPKRCCWFQSSGRGNSIPKIAGKVYAINIWKMKWTKKKRSATFNDHAKRKIKTELKSKALTNPVSERKKTPLKYKIHLSLVNIIRSTHYLPQLLLPM